MTDLLADALQAHYGAQGLTVEARGYKSILELRQTLPMLAVVKYDFLTDHFVTVLEVTETEVVVGDPLCGKSRYSHQAFDEIWRYAGLVLRRDNLPGRKYQ